MTSESKNVYNSIKKKHAESSICFEKKNRSQNYNFVSLKRLDLPRKLLILIVFVLSPMISIATFNQKDYNDFWNQKCII